jgi:pheromone a factor receptor
MADVGTDMDSPIVHPRSAHAYLLPILSFFAIVILIVPFKWHWRLKNIGACSLAFYLSLSNLFTLINAIIWPTDNYDQWWDGAGLCDIEAKLRWPLITGIACSTLCICRNLANVLDVERSEISSTRASKKRKMIIDILLCYGIPVLQILLHYIIQYNRYIIGVLAGCLPTYDESWPTIVIMYMWPPIFCIANAYYCGM